MRCCSVPFCGSSLRRKEPGVLFHEIPADGALRLQWLAFIARKDWVPNSNSNYAFVCSKHFTRADFKANVKTRHLKKGAVPTILP
ncbi:hypothetical protein HPB48_004478 [Haemaphysalis longicornis]|uniref:THAP-type domain-containing protein n=1 Tax=Haemaphysalis longicornis TaxID=44386 RepID=A0A9J6GIK1_HAELO|nr:hypothetical protein HPB48_004478 [Haemaphysalis longicornis]